MSTGNLPVLKVANEIVIIAQRHGRPITPQKLHKVLYYLQGAWLTHYKKPLFKEAIVAREGGPVVPTIIRPYQRYMGVAITEPRDSEIKLYQDEWLLLDKIVAVKTKYRGRVLADITTGESPWGETELDDVIKIQLISQYFNENQEILMK